MLGVQVAIILVLLAFNAFLAAAEIAIVSARRARMRSLADDGSPTAARVLHISENPSSFLATVQVGITLAGFFASAVGAVSLAHALAGSLDQTSVAFIQQHAAAIALVVVTILLSFVNIVFGELVPKTLAVTNAESVALRVVRTMDILGRITMPVAVLLTLATNGILRLIGAQGRARMPSVTEDELRVMLETAEVEGVVEAEEADLIEEAFQFGDTLVRGVMVPRVDVAALEAETPLREAIERFFATGYSRMPVYRETVDRVAGILYVKDVYHLLWDDPNAADTPVVKVVRPAFFVPETKPIDDLLRELRARHTHLAICVDEFGGMAGLVTLEDLLEELVGEITDEFDAGYEPFREISPTEMEVDGRISVADLLDRLDLPDDAIGPHEADSVGGVIIDQLGRIPTEGDGVQAGELHLEVRTMLGHRVGRVTVEHPASPDAEADGAHDEDERPA